MREIKFRVWDWERMLNDEAWMWNYDDLYLQDINSLFSNNEETIWMQYTWLKDEHWEEIYEGAVVDVKDEMWENWIDCWLWAVEFLVEWWLWNVSNIENWLADIMQSNHVEVIWNIYENPELLKPKK